MSVAIEDEMAAEATAIEMGWVPLELRRVLEFGCALTTSVLMTCRTATQRLKWFAPTHTENKVSNRSAELMCAAMFQAGGLERASADRQSKDGATSCYVY